MSRQHPGETYRHAVLAHRVNGGQCTVLVRRIGDTIELLFHADPHTGATLTPAQAQEIAEALHAASRAP